MNENMEKKQKWKNKLKVMAATALIVMLSLGGTLAYKIGRASCRERV